MLLRIVFICCCVQIVLPGQLLGDDKKAFDELYEVLMVRHAHNGVAFGQNEIAPIMFTRSGFPFDDATFPRLTAALDAITPEEIRTYSNVQLAIMQRQLWALFDATTLSRFVTQHAHDARRNTVRQKYTWPDPTIGA
jgi:hypothetical protein